ncbi:hypothetical protein SprV_0401535800 [Sparganum proliferum]
MSPCLLYLAVEHTVDIVDKDVRTVVKDQLINYQHPFSGLFPCKPGPPQSCACHVRDSVYCATAVWALHRCFQRLGDESGQSFELRQSAIKCMRAILLAWMQQTVRLEQFKTAQNLETCLSTRLDYATGQPIEGTDYNHLQIDCVGLYVLQLAQMILSGLQVIHTKTEAAFVQNLIFYLERAYRIPDYGMWERGSKQNRNITELHASSIGMAKAAMESLSGFNVFGVEGDHSTVIFTEGDAHSRNSMILDTLLPRESASKIININILPAPTAASTTAMSSINITLSLTLTTNETTFNVPSTTTLIIAAPTTSNEDMIPNGPPFDRAFIRRIGLFGHMLIREGGPQHSKYSLCAPKLSHIRH